jgi:hypothetical protein
LTSASINWFLPLKMQIKKRLGWIFVLTLLVTGGLWLWTQVQIDSCLDRGGSWDKERQMCEGAAA